MGRRRRLTFCSLQTSGSKLKLQCFVSDIIEKSGLDGEFSTITTNLPTGKTPVQLETNIHRSSKTLVLLVTFQDGEISVFSEDLSKVLSKWTMPKGAGIVQYATTISVMQARKGLLKRRDDLLVRMEASIAFSRLLVLVEREMGETTTTQSGYQLKVYGFVQSKPFTGATQLVDIEAIVSFDLAMPKPLQEDTGHHLHHTGQLYIWKGTKAMQYHLDGMLVRQGKSLDFANRVSSLLRISSNLIAIADTSCVRIIDTKHSAVSLTYPIPPSSTINGEVEVMSSAALTVRLLSYFPNLGMLVLLSGKDILTLDLSESGYAHVSQDRYVTLADAMGKGLSVGIKKSMSVRKELKAFGKVVEGISKVGRKTITAIDEVADSSNGDSFDALFMTLIPTIVGQPKGSKDTSCRSIATPSELAYHSTLLSHIISRIFALKPSSDNKGSPKGLRVRLMAPVTFQWLATHNLVTVHRVEQAFKQTGHLDITSRLQQCAVIEALAIHDYSLETLMFLLAGPSPLSLNEVACGARFALDVLQQGENLSRMKLIMDTEMADGSEPEGIEDKENLSTPEPEKNADRIHDAHSVMRVCFARLGVNHNSEIRKAFEEELPILKLLALVDYLRAELAGGGWFSDNIVIKTTSDEYIQDNGHINLMVKILNCTIDALGAGAWLNTTVSDEHAEKISWMKAETSAALEGIEEATYLQGLLHEALLFAKNVPPLPTPRNRSLVKPSGVSVVQPVRVMEDMEDNSLPLGLRPTDRVEKQVMQEGKMKKRSQREIGLLKSKMVGAYSIERIMI